MVITPVYSPGNTCLSLYTDTESSSLSGPFHTMLYPACSCVLLGPHWLSGCKGVTMLGSLTGATLEPVKWLAKTGIPPGRHQARFDTKLVSLNNPSGKPILTFMGHPGASNPGNPGDRLWLQVLQRHFPYITHKLFHCSRAPLSHVDKA